MKESNTSFKGYLLCHKNFSLLKTFEKNNVLVQKPQENTTLFEAVAIDNDAYCCLRENFYYLEQIQALCKVADDKPCF